MRRIGFTGVGIMGKSMVRNLMKAGYEVAIYTSTRSEVGDIIGERAIQCSNAGKCAKGRQAVVSIMGYPKNARDVYFGEGGIIADADPGTCLIDMTITNPRLAVWAYEEAEKVGLRILNVPVTGGDKGAKDGTLTILADGGREDFDAYLSILRAMGKNIDYEGKTGNRQHTKMCNQIAVAGALTGAYEAVVYAKNVGLGMDTMLKPISIEAASSVQVNNVASRTLQDNYRPGFFIKHFIKDMNLADGKTRVADTELKVLEDVLSVCRGLEQEDMGELGTQALIKYYN